jgi:hypothetical protein
MWIAWAWKMGGVMDPRSFRRAPIHDSIHGCHYTPGHTYCTYLDILHMGKAHSFMVTRVGFDEASSLDVDCLACLLCAPGIYIHNLLALGT